MNLDAKSLVFDAVKERFQKDGIDCREIFMTYYKSINAFNIKVGIFREGKMNEMPVDLETKEKTFIRYVFIKKMERMLAKMNQQWDAIIVHVDVPTSKFKIYYTFGKQTTEIEL
jgi:hypothetical protein